MGKVARCRSDDPYMFSAGDKLNICFTNVDGRHQFAVLSVVSLSGRENKQLGLAARKLDLVLGTVVEGEIKEVLNLMDGV